MERISNHLVEMFGGNEQINILNDFDIVSEKNSEIVSVGDYNSQNLIALSLVLANIDDNVTGYNHSYIHKVISLLDSLIEVQINSIISNTSFKSIEKEWLQLRDLCSDSYRDVLISILDVTKDELESDLGTNIYDISNSDLFKKVYIGEFDQYGGSPYGVILGLYDSENTDQDISMLTGMGMVAKAAHAPYIGSLALNFFGVSDASQIGDIKNFETLLQHPRYKNWNDFRNLDVSAYIGLTVGDYMLRSPYHSENNPVSHKMLKSFCELIDYEDNNSYIWGASAVKFVKNIMRSYDKTRWFQYIRGIENGGYVENMIYAIFENRGIEEIKPPMNLLLPDNVELSLAKVGFIPLISEKNTNNACFFSTNSIKKIEEYEDIFDSANSQLVANIAYTLCISRISHFIKAVIRHKIGSVVGVEEIKQIITEWINQFVTTVFNPTPVEMARFPFRFASVEVSTMKGKPGWFNSKVIVIPHIQFEGMNTKMTIDTKLDPSIFV